MDTEEELLEAPLVVVEPVEDETTFTTGEVDTMSEDLQDLYTFFADEYDQGIAQILVWDGAAKNERIKEALQNVHESSNKGIEVYYGMKQRAVMTYYQQRREIFPCNQILTAEEFKKGLTQRPEEEEGCMYWLLLLAHCPESVLGELPDLLDDMPWGELIITLGKYTKHSEIMGAKEHLFKIWGTVTKLQDRKKLLQDLNTLKPKVCERTLEFLLGEGVTFPLDDLQGDKGQPCLVVECPTDSLGVKLFQHTMKTLRDFDMCDDLMALVDQQIEDSKLAAIIKDLVGQKELGQAVAQNMAFVCTESGLVLSCAELVQVVPYREQAFREIVIEGNDETTCLKALEVLHPDLFHPNSFTWNNRNALHLTATTGFTVLCKGILARGFHRLLEKKAEFMEGSFHPASMAVQAAHFDTAKELLQAMKKSEAKALLTRHDDDHPEIDLHHVMKEANQGYRSYGRQWDVKTDGWVPGPKKLEKREIQERVDFIQAALDTTIDDHFMDLTVLLTDEDVQIEVESPEDKKNGENDQDKEEGKEGESGFGAKSPEDEKEKNKNQEKRVKKGLEKTLYHKIAKSDFEDLKSHECFVTLTTIMWTDYGIMQGILFFLHLLFMAFLTTSLVLAARTSGPSEYDGSLDWFRLFCEIVTFLWTLTTLGLEIYELGTVIYKSLKKSFINGSGSDSEESNEEKQNPYLALIKDTLSNYLLDWQNILDDVAILCTLLIIPFRIVDSDVQWVFAALAFIFHGLRIFKYAIMFKSVGEYVAILILLIKRDVPQFVTVFLVIILSLGGGLYFALTGNYSNENIDTENNNDTSEIYLLWWTGIRILAEGGVLTYYGPGGFNWLGVLIYWLFLFIVTVVLLNILIAQFSKSYEEETERAQINVILTRTKIILKMEESILTHFLVNLIKTVRRKLTRDEIDYSTVGRLHLAGETKESKPANSKQVEELQMQTTDLRLLLDGTSKNVSEVEKMVVDSRQALHNLQTEVGGKLVDLEKAHRALQAEVEGKLVGLERAVLDTRHFAEDIKEILMSMKEK